VPLTQLALTELIEPAWAVCLSIPAGGPCTGGLAVKIINHTQATAVLKVGDFVFFGLRAASRR
jgi:hypothetical protein